MPYAVLEQKLRLVPESEFDFVSQILDFVLSRNSKPEKANAETKEEKKAIRKLGQWKGQVWMADDFDETPECFKDYV
ncbi:DUF2281 domain-containing protein [uncultured Treponema sp.]|uniref:DUF2281 domain-containing protein n=1 Tax=uncultured Treponema sp. TaxID=162155 RepID=UPI0025D4F1FF|nr:DUF2281 domain-containing protein [uncultured Treponema sp.]